MALNSIASLCELHLFRKKILLGVISKVKYLMLHPNVWIRYGCVAVVAAGARCLSQVDRVAILLPAIQPLLQYEGGSLSEQDLLSKLSPPVTRQSLNKALLVVYACLQEQHAEKSAGEKASAAAALSAGVGRLMSPSMPSSLVTGQGRSPSGAVRVRREAVGRAVSSGFTGTPSSGSANTSQVVLGGNRNSLAVDDFEMVMGDRDGEKKEEEEERGAAAGMSSDVTESLHRDGHSLVSPGGTRHVESASEKGSSALIRRERQSKSSAFRNLFAQRLGEKLPHLDGVEFSQLVGLSDYLQSYSKVLYAKRRYVFRGKFCVKEFLEEIIKGT